MKKIKVKIKKGDCDFDITKVTDIGRVDIFEDYIEIEFEVGK